MRVPSEKAKVIRPVIHSSTGWEASTAPSSPIHPKPAGTLAARA